MLAVFDAAITWAVANTPKGCSAINARAELGAGDLVPTTTATTCCPRSCGRRPGCTSCCVTCATRPGSRTLRPPPAR
ncbi:hypothetical protein BC477_08845 [Clavibacter michiganensis subsp. michiganensis]|nr:hypothetical protein BC477_08845 [Clavibacter michiganensis subsp. michiganensis]